MICTRPHAFFVILTFFLCGALSASDPVDFFDGPSDSSQSASSSDGASADDDFFADIDDDHDNRHDDRPDSNPPGNADADAENSPDKPSVHAELMGEGATAGERKTLTVKGIDYTFRWCPAGEFTMGSPESEEGHGDDEKAHTVRLTHGFWLLETEVTQAMWESVMGATVEEQAMQGTSSHSLFGKGPAYPICFVSWEESVEFCRKLSDLTGERVQLPTEAQWEYACRAGSAGAYGGSGQLDEMGWYTDNSESVLHAVKEKAPNAWGLYDMHGNITEWCADWHCDYDTETVQVDPTGHSTGIVRVIRGGSWYNNAEACRSAFRYFGIPTERHNMVGFRPVLIPAGDDFFADIDDDHDNRHDDRPDSNPPGNADADAENSPDKPSVHAEPMGEGATAGERKTLTVKGIDYTFRWCPAGEFTMGSPESEEGRFDDELQHHVTLTRGFWLLESEVTQEQWEAVMGTTVTDQRDKADKDLLLVGVGPHYPMYYVDWSESVEFCRKLSDLTGERVQLPTESQWEYACRAGSKTALYTGDMKILGINNAPALDKISWYGGNSGEGYSGGEVSGGYDSSGWEEKQYTSSPSGTHEVKGKTANAWGLYDMIGNTLEWCSDWYGDNPSGAVTDPAGPSSGSGRVSRGGSWDCFARGCRSAIRIGLVPSYRDNSLGLRPAVVPVSEDSGIDLDEFLVIDPDLD